MAGPPASAYTAYRLLEIIPAALIWATLVGAVALTVAAPAAAVVFIVGFDLLWLTRVLYAVGLVLVGYGRLRTTIRVPWHTLVAADPRAGRIWQVVILPTYREPLAVVRASFAALSRCATPLGRLFVVLATEARDAANARPLAAAVTAEFGPSFGGFLVTEHPDGIPDEVAGKGANITFAGRRVAAELDRRGIAYRDALVTTLDVDSVVHPEYFALLTYQFLHAPKPHRTSFQPIPVFANNLWDAPLVTRVVSMATTFWLLAETVRPERLFTFSSHSMSFQTLVDVGFWQSDIVTEDSRIFVQGLLHYNGDYTVTPLYLPVSMDAVEGATVLAGLSALYRQQRRWAYGVENFPFMAWNFAEAPEIPRAVKFRYLWNQLEGVYSWATAPFVIFLLGWIPLRLAAVANTPSPFLQTAPVVLHWILTISLLGLAVCASLTLGVMAAAGAPRRRRAALSTALSWVLFPAAMVIFGSIPATDAATRLAVGHYLGFNVTAKVRRGRGALREDQAGAPRETRGPALPARPGAGPG